MANTIRLKRASGSDPGASDLVTGELAVRTDNGKLFTKKDDNSVTEIGVTVLGDNDVTTAKIADDAVTAAKLASNSVVNASVTSNAAIAGSKIDPDFGSQSITTLGNITCGDGSSGVVTIKGNQAIIQFTDTNDNDDYKIRVDGGLFRIQDQQNGTVSLQINTDGHVDIPVNLDVGDGLDVTGNIAVSGTVDGRDVAADGTKLDGIASGATNVTNTNQLTNGAGFITATLTNEQVQDIVGGMVSGNTETGITVTYQDGDGTLDFVVGTLNQDTTGNAATATALETARNIGGVSFDGTGNINLPGVNTSGNQDTSGNAATATALATARTIAGVSFDGTANISLNNNAITNGAGYITATLTNEQVQDIVGAMVSGNTESGISVTYQDSDGTLDFSVASQTDNNFTTTLKNKLDGIASGATNVTNNNQLTNGAGYITSADGGNAATLDSIDSSQFLRSDTADSASGLLTLSGGLALSGKVGAAITAASDGSTITLNLGANTHQSVTLGGNRTFAAPSNQTVGQSGSIFITQDGTGSRTASFNSAFKFVGGTAPTLSTAANAVDRIDYVIKSSNVIHCAVSLDVK